MASETYKHTALLEEAFQTTLGKFKYGTSLVLFQLKSKAVSVDSSSYDTNFRGPPLSNVFFFSSSPDNGWMMLMHCSLVFCPNIIIFIAFMLYGVKQGKLTVVV